MVSCSSIFSVKKATSCLKGADCNIFVILRLFKTSIIVFGVSERPRVSSVKRSADFKRSRFVTSVHFLYTLSIKKTFIFQHQLSLLMDKKRPQNVGALKMTRVYVRPITWWLISWESTTAWTCFSSPVGTPCKTLSIRSVMRLVAKQIVVSTVSLIMLAFDTNLFLTYNFFQKGIIHRET